MIKPGEQITFSGRFGDFYIGNYLTCSSCPEKTFLILHQESSTLYICEVFRLGRQFDVTNKNPLIWFIERMF